LEVPRNDPARNEARRGQAEDLSAALLTAAEFYRSALKDAPDAIDYLKGRGLTGAIAARFGLGYAPDDWQPLTKAFADYQNRALETAGLVIAGEGGKRYDRFRGRIMFPIHDARGQVIGFGGRVLDDGEPKYLNSPETPVFAKGRELYGLFQARQAIRSTGRVVVVEGYMDVIALAQHGVEYAVATLGTATTPVHAQKLFRMTDTVVFCFDGDEAGRRAAWRALENALPVLSDGKQPRFLFLPQGEDPDDAIRRRGREAFEALVDSAIPLSEFLVEELVARFPPVSAEGRAALLSAAKPLLEQVGAPMLSALLRRRLAVVAGLPESELAGLLPVARDQAGQRPTVPSPRRIAPSLLRGLIKCVLLEPQLVRRFEVPRPTEAGEEGAALAALADLCVAAETPLTTAGVMQHFATSPHEPVLVEALTAGESEGLSAESLEIQLMEGVKRYWAIRQRRDGISGAGTVELSPEEAERARQRGLVQERLARGA
jgi:DNA primase